MTIEGLLGRKLGTVQVFDAKGRLRGATAVEVGPCFVTHIRTPESDGYRAVQVGFQDDRRLNKPEAGPPQSRGQPQASPPRRIPQPTDAGSATRSATASAPSCSTPARRSTSPRPPRAAASRVASAATISPAAPRHTARATAIARRARSAPAPRRAASTRARAWPATWAPNDAPSATSKSISRNDEKGVIFVGGSVPGPDRRGIVRIRSARKVSK